MNVLLVTIDAWRASHASFAGADRSYTPALESLATDGVAFTQAVSHGPATPYAFPALFTSTQPLDHGGYERIAPERRLLSEALADAGHRCVGVHGNPWLGEKYGYARGYDAYHDVGEFTLPLLDRTRELLIDRFGLDHPVYRAAQTAYRRAQGPIQRLRNDTGEAAEVTVARGALRDGSDFVWMHLLAPHAPYDPPERHREWADVPADVDGTALSTRAQRDPDGLTDTECETIERLYAASVRHADEQVDAVLDAATDETLVVVTADHGEALFEHGQVGHEPALYDELVHVPLLVRPPASSPVDTGQVDTQVRHVDVAPTILDYAGVDVPPTFTGRSLRPLVEGTSDETTDRIAVSEVASSRTTPGRVAPEALQLAVRLPDRKLIATTGEVRGYDLREDPGERAPITDPDGGPWTVLSDALTDRRASIAFTETHTADRDEAVEQRLKDLGYLD